LPLKIDLGEVVQGAILAAIGLVLIVIWLLARVLSFILPFGSPESLLYIGVILLIGGIGLALTGFRYRRRSRR
jgi:protein-S-isoprenylcysteine O-methyltransferase Ste14